LGQIGGGLWPIEEILEALPRVTTKLKGVSEAERGGMVAGEPALRIRLARVLGHCLTMGGALSSLRECAGKLLEKVSNETLEAISAELGQLAVKAGEGGGLKFTLKQEGSGKVLFGELFTAGPDRNERSGKAVEVRVFEGASDLAKSSEHSVRGPSGGAGALRSAADVQAFFLEGLKTGTLKFAIDHSAPRGLGIQPRGKRKPIALFGESDVVTTGEAMAKELPADGRASLGIIGSGSTMMMEEVAERLPEKIIVVACSEGPEPSWSCLPSFDGKTAFHYPHGVWLRAFLLLVFFGRCLPAGSDLREAIYLATLYCGVGGMLSVFIKEGVSVPASLFCGSGSLELAPLLRDQPCWPLSRAFFSPMTNSVALSFVAGRIVLEPGESSLPLKLSAATLRLFLETRQEQPATVGGACARAVPDTSYEGKPHALFDAVSKRLKVSPAAATEIWECNLVGKCRVMTNPMMKAIGDALYREIQLGGVTVLGEVYSAIEELVATNPEAGLTAVKELLSSTK
jgi:hypothetical protein